MKILKEEELLKFLKDYGYDYYIVVTNADEKLNNISLDVFSDDIVLYNDKFRENTTYIFPKKSNNYSTIYYED